jgi:cob(I)alamin adenosyltransferase
MAIGPDTSNTRNSLQRNLKRAQTINHLRDCLDAARAELAHIDETLNNPEIVLGAETVEMLEDRARVAEQEISKLRVGIAQLLD